MVTVHRRDAENAEISSFFLLSAERAESKKTSPSVREVIALTLRRSNIESPG
jgi:hypothetical protein